MPYALNSGENLLLRFTLLDLPSGSTWKGLWDGTVAYAVNDAVIAPDNNGYLCILAHTNHQPPNATYWTLLSNILALNVVGVVVELVDSNGKSVVSYTYSRGVPQTSGMLTVGARYIIASFAAGDDFTNVGAASNTTGVVFIASNTTPTTWTNGSVLQQMTIPLNIILQDGLLRVELLKGDTLLLDGDYELRVTISIAAAMYIQSGAQTDVLCLPEALSITPC